MKLKIKKFTCCICDYVWIKGQDGSHNCSEHMIKKPNIENLEHVINGTLEDLSLEAAGRGSKGFIKWTERVEAARAELDIIKGKE